jgi:hypothetical protein
MRLSCRPVLVIEPSGCATDTRFVVAAEWVAIHSSRASGASTLRFVPGGTSHALDSTTETVLCGAEPDGLQLFAVDYLTDSWGHRCAACERLVSVVAHRE